MLQLVEEKTYRFDGLCGDAVDEMEVDVTELVPFVQNARVLLGDSLLQVRRQLTEFRSWNSSFQVRVKIKLKFEAELCGNISGRDFSFSAPCALSLLSPFSLTPHFRFKTERNFRTTLV